MACLYWTHSFDVRLSPPPPQLDEMDYSNAVVVAGSCRLVVDVGELLMGCSCMFVGDMGWR